MTDKVVPSLLATLLERLASQETLELDFKAARRTLPKEIWPTVSAFANTRGGWILLGVVEQGNTFVVEGVENASKIVHEFYSLVRNPEKINYSVCGPEDVSIENVGDKDVIATRVPEASRKERPVHINGHPYLGTYIRRHAGDYRCTKSEVNRMVREASDIAADATILPHFNWSDLDTDTLARYRRRYQT